MQWRLEAANARNPYIADYEMRFSTIPVLLLALVTPGCDSLTDSDPQLITLRTEFERYPINTVGILSIANLSDQPVDMSPYGPLASRRTERGRSAPCCVLPGPHPLVRIAVDPHSFGHVQFHVDTARFEPGGEYRFTVVVEEREYHSNSFTVK